MAFNQDDIENELPTLEQLNQLAGTKAIEEDVAPEVQNSEEIAQEAINLEDSLPSSTELSQSPLTELIPSVSPTPSPINDRLQRYQDSLNEYNRLQRNRQLQLGLIGMAEGASEIGRGFAEMGGAKFDDQPIKFQGARDLANLPVTDFEQKQKVRGTEITRQDETEARDPKSRMSELYRTYATNKLGMTLDPSVSAYDIQALLKQLGKPAQAKGNQIVRSYNPTTGQIELQAFDPSTGQLKSLNATAGFALQTKQDPRTKETTLVNPATGQIERMLTGPSKVDTTKPEEQRQITYDNLNTKQQERLVTDREKFLKDVDQDREAINAASSIQDSLRAGKEIGGDILRSIQNQLARGSGEKGAMTENDVAGFGGRASLVARLQRAASMASTGKLPEADRKFLVDFANIMEKRARKYVDNKSEFFVNNLYNDFKSSPNLKNAGLQKRHVQDLLGVQSVVRMGEAKSTDLKSTEVRRKTKDGKTAIFDTSTNPPKFVRYEK